MSNDKIECRVERRVERRVECRVECRAYFTVVRAEDVLSCCRLRPQIIYSSIKIFNLCSDSQTRAIFPKLPCKPRYRTKLIDNEQGLCADSNFLCCCSIYTSERMLSIDKQHEMSVRMLWRRRLDEMYG